MKRELYNKSGKKKCVIFNILMDDFSRPMSAEYRVSVIDDKEKIRIVKLQRRPSTKEYFFEVGQETYIVPHKELALLLLARLENDFNMRQGWY